MRKISVVAVTGILLFFISIRVLAQNINRIKPVAIAPYHLAITYAKTTNLVFPFDIRSVDRGSKAVLAQKAKNVQNILQIKAGKHGFKQTNLTVITADGRLYSFLLNYAADPSVLNLRFRNCKLMGPQASFRADNVNEAVIQAYAKKAFGLRDRIHGIHDRKYGIKLILNGIFIHGNVMYYRIRIDNPSNISYTINQLRFFICDKKKAKRTASQEIEVKPLYIYHDVTAISGQTAHTLVVALTKFTIPEKKYLNIQLMEKNGGRNLELRIKNKKIIKAVQM